MSESTNTKNDPCPRTQAQPNATTTSGFTNCARKRVWKTRRFSRCRSSTRGRKGPYRELSFIVSGQGDVDKLTKFLYGFYATDNLHRIRSLNLTPLPDSRQLKIMMIVDAISMESFDLEQLQKQTEQTLSKEQLEELAQKVAVGTRVEDRLPLGLADYLSQITGRNLFRAGESATADQVDFAAGG